jgi:hypothetical protein
MEVLFPLEEVGAISHPVVFWPSDSPPLSVFLVLIRFPYREMDFGLRRMVIDYQCASITHLVEGCYECAAFAGSAFALSAYAAFLTRCLDRVTG